VGDGTVQNRERAIKTARQDGREAKAVVVTNLGNLTGALVHACRVHNRVPLVDEVYQRTCTSPQCKPSSPSRRLHNLRSRIVLVSFSFIFKDVVGEGGRRGG
jgi:hypothetical protein